MHVAAGKAALGRGDLAAAAASQRAALALDPAHAGAVNELGLISLRSRDRASAARYFARAARSEPGCAVFGQNAALALAGIARRLAAEAVAAVLLRRRHGRIRARRRQPVLAALAAAGAGLMAWRAIGTLARLPVPVRRQLARSLRARRAAGRLALDQACTAGSLNTSAGALAACSRSGSGRAGPHLEFQVRQRTPGKPAGHRDCQQADCGGVQGSSSST